jgi:hypothetical protein
MDEKLKEFQDRLDFIEFKQGLLFFKQPQHKASPLYEISSLEYIQLKNLLKIYEEKIENDEKINLEDYEFEIYKICPQVKKYSDSAKLISKVILKPWNYERLYYLAERR